MADLLRGQLLFLCGWIGMLFPSVVQADEASIQVIPARAGVFMLMGQGGNIGLSLGEDAPFIVDDQYAPISEKIKATLAAHIPASPKMALPVITFREEIDFHWNGDDIHVFHVAPAHTDGDSMVHFRKANVLHMGDTYFNGFYPFIDTSTGGRIDGMIAAARQGLSIANDDTLIIPGHGPLSNRQELATYITMLEGVRANVQKLLDQGASIDIVVESKPTQAYDAQWADGFLAPEVFVRIVAESLTPNLHAPQN